MSQYGAYGYAEHGMDYRSSSATTTGGRRLEMLPGAPGIVRVLVGISDGDIGFSGADQRLRQALDPAATTRRTGRRAREAAQRRRPPLADCGRKLRAAGDGRIEIAGIGAYRGALEVVPPTRRRSLNAINAVPVDQYVKGVIPNESPPSWPQAALRAQAVAARSFALTVQVSGNGFDLYDDTSSQVYEGLAARPRPPTSGGSDQGQV
jgi:stage II sporulation protein D